MSLITPHYADEAGVWELQPPGQTARPGGAGLLQRGGAEWRVQPRPEERPLRPLQQGEGDQVSRKYKNKFSFQWSLSFAQNT